MRIDPDAMLKLAVFDLDGTLLKGTSAENHLLRYLRRERLIGPLQLFYFLGEMLRLLPQGVRATIRRNKKYLRRIRVTRFAEALPTFCREYLHPRLSPGVTRRMLELKGQGYCIVLLSGSLQPILEELKALLPADEVLGSVVEIEDGLFTGRVLGLHPYGRDKLLALEKHFSSQRIGYAESYAFADRHSDIPLLEKFGHPVAVHPDKKLRRVAVQRGWEIVE